MRHLYSTAGIKLKFTLKDKRHSKSIGCQIILQTSIQEGKWQFDEGQDSHFEYNRDKELSLSLNELICRYIGHYFNV